MPLPIVFAPLLGSVSVLMTGKALQFEHDMPLDYAEALLLQLTVAIMLARQHTPARCVADLMV